MSKHTPGPWIFEERVAGFDILAPESVYYVAEYLGVDCGVIDNIADAYLIAAAPELLEALEFMVWYTELVYSSEILKKLEDKARAAITKAKGHTVRVNGGPQERHRCELHSESGGHGEAVEVCLEDEEGKLWVENGEYASVVYFCPVCGYTSRAKAKGE